MFSDALKIVLTLKAITDQITLRCNGINKKSKFLIRGINEKTQQENCNTFQPSDQLSDQNSGKLFSKQMVG